ncbi:MAG: AI-2E family transporter [Firmicutes bacterium]|nr:AI-2E family transporter [Bacillota bacterium]
MKLPWDKQYLKISFHIIFTVLLIYLLAYMVGNLGEIKQFVFLVIAKTISVFAPVIIALLFSFLMNPAVDFFQKIWEKYVPNKKEQTFPTRKKGTATVYVLWLLLFYAIVQYVVIKIGTTDITALADKINAYIQDFSDVFVLISVKLAEYGIFQNIEGILAGWTTNISELLQASIMSVANSISKAGGWAINIVLGLTIAFYVLVEKNKILYYCKNIVEVFFHKRAENIKEFCRLVTSTFSNYITGQVTDAFIMAILISVSFFIAKIPYAVMIGIISGFSNLIPYVGAVIAFLLSVAMGLLSDEPIRALYAVIIVLVLQQVDSILIVPKVVGKSVELHPAFVIISLAVFGGLFGILGMIVAVPLGALIKIFMVRLYEWKKNKISEIE